MGELYLILLSSVLLFYAVFACTWLGKHIGVGAESKAGFNSNLEVLRGLAAFSVFLAHTTMYFGYLAPRYIVSTYSGSLGVNIFFMLTAYLFWKQVVNKKIDFNNFFLKRIYRLVPIVLIVVTFVTIVDYIISPDKVMYFDRFVALLKNYMFGFAGVNDVFSPNMYLRINTIWTLKWEWLFYFTLPVLAVWPKKTTLILALVFSILAFTDINKIFSGDSDVVFFIAFFLGALSVHCEIYLEKFFGGIRSLVFLLLALFFVCFMFYFSFKNAAQYKSLLSTLSACLIFLFFLSSAPSLFNKLSQGLQLLGKVSYSFYLWHLSINFYAVSFIKKYMINDESVFFSSPNHYFLFGIVTISLSLTISFVTYKYVEAFFLRKAHAPLEKSEVNAQ